MKKQVIYFMAAALAMPVVFTSCTEETSDTTPMPKIITMGVDAENIIQLNDTLNITPQLSTTEGVSYLWTLDGDSVGASSSYTFIANETGKFNLSFTAANIAGLATQTIEIEVRKVFGGFYVINEGAYPNPASFNYYKNNSWAFNSFDEFSAQVDYTFGQTGTTAAVSNGAMYMVTKNAPVLSKINMQDWTAETVIDSRDLISGGQGQSICLIPDNKAVLTTTRGAFIVDLNQKAIVDTLTNSNTTDAFINGDYMYMIVSDSINVYKTTDLALVNQAVAAAKTGFTKTEAGDVWAADDSTLIRFVASNPTEAEQIALPSGYKVNYNEWAYTPTGLTAAKGKNMLYFGSYSGWLANTISAYDIDNGSVKNIYTLEGANDFLYGSGIHVNPETGNLYLVSTPDYRSFAIDIVTPEGEKQERIVYGDQTTLWYPSRIIFD